MTRSTMAHPYLDPHSHDPGRWLLIPRPTIDALLARYPRWMSDVWPLLQKDWRIGGASVKLPTHPGHLHDMRGCLAMVGMAVGA